MERDDVLIQIRIVVATAIVVFDYIFERCQATVVHVRSAPAYVAQGWGFECALVIGLGGDGCPAFILQRALAPGYAGVVKHLVGESRTSMTGIASCFIAKQAQTFEFKVAERARPSPKKKIEVAVFGADGAHIAGQRICQRLASQATISRVLM